MLHSLLNIYTTKVIHRRGSLPPIYSTLQVCGIPIYIWVQLTSTTSAFDHIGYFVLVNLSGARSL